MCSRCIRTSSPLSMSTMLGNLQKLGVCAIILWISKYLLSVRTVRSGTVILPMSIAAPIESSSYAASMAMFLILALCVSSVRCSSLHGPVVLFWLRLLLRIYNRLLVFFKQEITLPCLLIICCCWYPLSFFVYVATCAGLSILLLCYLLAFFVVTMMIRESEGILCVRAILVLFASSTRPGLCAVLNEKKIWRECIRYLSVSYHLW